MSDVAQTHRTNFGRFTQWKERNLTKWTQAKCQMLFFTLKNCGLRSWTIFRTESVKIGEMYPTVELVFEFRLEVIKIYMFNNKIIFYYLQFFPRISVPSADHMGL